MTSAKPVNLRVARTADGDYVKPMFWHIAQMMVIALGRCSASNAGKGFDGGKIAATNSQVNSTLCHVHIRSFLLSALNVVSLPFSMFGLFATLIDCRSHFRARSVNFPGLLHTGFHPVLRLSNPKQLSMCFPVPLAVCLALIGLQPSFYKFAPTPAHFRKLCFLLKTLFALSSLPIARAGLIVKFVQRLNGLAGCACLFHDHHYHGWRLEWQ